MRGVEVGHSTQGDKRKGRFEREVAAESIRDKVRAYRMKGMWMGGYVPLGYDVKDRKLVVNEDEAAAMRGIFERFVEVGSATVLARELRRRALRNKQGTLVDKGYLYRVLMNRIYRGEAAVRLDAHSLHCRGRDGSILRPPILCPRCGTSTPRIRRFCDRPR
ncbi:recombinase family protein [Tropicimonas sp. IMCC34043]|uniref:recombinase family protein n=1 Tax=Tropicimonas sp. IMCC34043 TaxID=2248760 RepID=UPI001E359F32|nr:recombinase family protein [Tropicimonas sp. IMCC34043]